MSCCGGLSNAPAGSTSGYGEMGNPTFPSGTPSALPTSEAGQNWMQWLLVAAAGVGGLIVGKNMKKSKTKK